MNDFPTFKLPGDGLACGNCGEILPTTERRTNTPGLIIRQKDCPKCGERSTTVERVISTRPKRGYFRQE